MQSTAPQLKFLKKIAPQVWETPAHLLYAENSQSISYEKLKKNKNYNSFHRDTIRLMRQNARSICKNIGEPFTLIDLGAEDADKTLPLMKCAKKYQFPFDYIPVDVNQQWMQTAERAGRPYAGKVIGIQSLFEECSYQVSQDVYRKKFVFIGLTFMNFDPHCVLGMMKTIAGKDGFVGIAQELLTPENSIEAILAHYKTKAVHAMCLGAAAQLGLDVHMANLIFDTRFENGRIEAGFILKAPSKKFGMEAGDRLITAFSHRRTFEELRRFLEANTARPEIWTSGATALAIAQV